MRSDFGVGGIGDEPEHSLQGALLGVAETTVVILFALAVVAAAIVLATAGA